MGKMQSLFGRSNTRPHKPAPAAAASSSGSNASSSTELADTKAALKLDQQMVHDLSHDLHQREKEFEQFKIQTAAQISQLSQEKLAAQRAHVLMSGHSRNLEEKVSELEYEIADRDEEDDFCVRMMLELVFGKMLEDRSTAFEEIFGSDEVFLELAAKRQHRREVNALKHEIEKLKQKLAEKTAEEKVFPPAVEVTAVDGAVEQLG